MIDVFLNSKPLKNDRPSIFGAVLWLLYPKEGSVAQRKLMRFLISIYSLTNSHDVI